MIIIDTRYASGRPEAYRVLQSTPAHRRTVARQSG
jgi:hypothetical protein